MTENMRRTIETWSLILTVIICVLGVILGVGEVQRARFVRYRAEQRQWRQATTAGTLVQVEQPKRGRPVIGPRLSRED
jgi:hypothetical protein